MASNNTVMTSMAFDVPAEQRSPPRAMPPALRQRLSAVSPSKTLTMDDFEARMDKAAELRSQRL